MQFCEHCTPFLGVSMPLFVFQCKYSAITFHREENFQKGNKLNKVSASNCGSINSFFIEMYAGTNQYSSINCNEAI